MSTVYKCKSCGAPLRFDPHTGKLKCDHCDSYFFPYEYHHTRFERKTAPGTSVQGAVQNPNSQAPTPRPPQEFNAQAPTQRPPQEFNAQAPTQRPTPEFNIQDPTQEFNAQGPAQPLVQDPNAQPSTPEPQGPGLALYHCPNCGAELLTENTAIADKCVYCGYPVAFAGTLAGEFTPDFLLPFEKDVSDAISGYKEVLKSAPFAPKVFREQSTLERFRGVYVPVWLYTMDVEAKIDVHGRVAGKKILGYTDYGPITQEGSEIITVHEEGVIHYENIARDGLRELDDLIVKCLSPYDYWKRRAFDASYLAGFYAQRWDVDFDICHDEVCREVLDAATWDIHEHACDLGTSYADKWDYGDDMRPRSFTRANAKRWDGGVSINGGNPTNSSGQNFIRTTTRLDPDGGFKVLGNDVLPPDRGTGYEGHIVGDRVEYALVPVWLMYTKYRDKDYMFAMNGQTGEIDGNMPVSIPRVMAYLGLTALMVLAIVLLDVWLSVQPDMDGGILIAGLLPVMWFLNLVRKQSSVGLSEKNAEPVRERLYRRLVHEEKEDF